MANVGILWISARTYVQKNQQAQTKEKKNCKSEEESNKELNALIEKKFQKFEKRRKGGRQKNSHYISMKYRHLITIAK